VTRFKPSPALILSVVALIAALAGTAFAAGTIGSSDVKNNSLKSADLKDGAGVKGVDAKDDSLKGSAFADGSVTGADVADDSLTGASVNESSLSVSRLVAKLGGASGAPVTGSISPITLPNGAYTQGADSTDTYIAGGDVTFAASCTQPRNITGYLVIDGIVPAASTIAGAINLADTGTGAVTRHFNVNPNSVPGTPGMTQFRTGSPVNHQFVLYLGANCNSGSGVTLNSVGVDVLSNR